MGGLIATRRDFLGAMLAAATGPAIVRASSLMRIAAPSGIVPVVWELQYHRDAQFVITMEDFIEGQVAVIARQIAAGIDADVMATALNTRLIDTPLIPQWRQRTYAGR